MVGCDDIAGRYGCNVDDGGEQRHKPQNWISARAQEEGVFGEALKYPLSTADLLIQPRVTGAIGISADFPHGKKGEYQDF
jgi:hypothetical protein